MRRIFPVLSMRSFGVLLALGVLSTFLVTPFVDEAQGAIPAPTTFVDLYPELPDGSSGWYITDPEIFLYADQSGSTYYQWDSTLDAGWVLAVDLVTAPQGEHELNYYSVGDIAGVTSDIQSLSFKVDSIRPTGSITTDAQRRFAVPGTPSARLIADDPGGTGVAMFRLSTDGIAWEPWSSFDAEHKWTPTASSPIDGRQLLFAQVMDAAGGISPAIQGVALVDGLPPALEIVGPGDSKGRVTVRKPGVDFSVTDAQSGLTGKGARIMLDGRVMGWRAPRALLSGGLFHYRFPKKLKKGRHCVEVRLSDRMGLKSAAKRCFTVGPAIKAPGRYHSSRDDHKPWVVVVHSTQSEFPYDYRALRGWSDRMVSAHVYVRSNGVVYRIIPDARSAWHAGRSSLRGKHVSGSVNRFSLGIELESLDEGPESYTPAQIEAAAEVVKEWQRKYKIKSWNVVSHARIAPGRKSDPRHLEWAQFWKAVDGS